MKTTKKLLTVILSAVMVFTLATSTISPFVSRTAAETYCDWQYSVSNGDGDVTDDDVLYLLYHVFFPEDYPIA